MTEENERKFTGFSPETLKFLRALKANNNKKWFEAHRKGYEKHVLGPLRDLVGDLTSGFNMIAPFYHYLQKILKIAKEQKLL
jgi:uncharacterized protein (DUF2461 family)